MDLFSDLNPKIEPPADVVSGSNGMMLCGILIVLIIIFAFYMFSRQVQVVEQKCSDRFNKNVILYTRESCPWCTKQMELLNKYGVQDKITICDVSNDQCGKDFTATKIQGLPAFVIKGDPTKNSIGFRDDLCDIADNLGLKK